MKIAILSDIHDNIWNLRKAFAKLQEAEAMICCGDLCSPFMIKQLASGFPDKPIEVVFGNNDADHFRMTMLASRLENIHLHGELFQGEFDGKRFAANHFNHIGMQLAKSGDYDVVCFGHNHQYQVEQTGSSLFINPGTVMGYDPINDREITATCAIYDTDSGEVRKIQL